MEGTATQRAALDGRLTVFDLVEYARKHRYRLRNLNDGGPCPPAIWKRPKSYEPTGEAERCYAIVGHSGYIVDEGELDRLGIALFYKSAKGVNVATVKIKAMRGTVKQEGDTEIAGTVPVVNGERHTFMHDLVREMRGSGWRYCDELIWMMPNPLPRRAAGRLKDSFQRILHFSLSRNYAFYPDAVRQPAKPTNGQNKRYRTSVGGFKIDAANFEYADTALPGNVLTCAHVSQSLLHDSAHPDQLALLSIDQTSLSLVRG
jgi:hypothetical protein